MDLMFEVEAGQEELEMRPMASQLASRAWVPEFSWARSPCSFCSSFRESSTVPFSRDAKALEERQASNVGAPPELHGDEDDEDTILDDEESCRRAGQDAVGAVVEAAPS